MWLVLALVLLLVATGVVVWLLTRGEDPNPGDGTGDGAGSSEVGGGSTPADVAYGELPRADALPAATLVVPRIVDGNHDLYLVDSTDGSTVARLTEEPSEDVGPILGPDRDTIVYVRRTADGSELWVVASDGSGPRPLFENPVEGCASQNRPAWNPVEPSQLVVACIDDPSATALKVVGLDGVVVRTLPTDTAVVDDLAFSPDGTRVAYWGGAAGSTSGNVYTLAVDGSGAPQQVTDGGGDTDVVWSSTGRLAVARPADGGRQIVVMDDDGSNASSLTSGWADQGPVWSPDGSMIAFKSNRPVPGADAGEHYWVIDADGGDPRSIDAEGVTTTTAAWGHR
jgi:Tol biopolymer transport system component